MINSRFAANPHLPALHMAVTMVMEEVVATVAAAVTDQ